MTKQHVFISYCHENQPQVRELRDSLDGAGEKVWWDQELLPGQDIQFEIRQAMKKAYAVILCISKETEQRDRSGIYPEWRDAVKLYRQYSPGSSFIIPVRLSDCNLPPLEIDDTKTLDELLSLDYFPASAQQANLQRLIQALQGTPEHP